MRRVIADAAVEILMVGMIGVIGRAEVFDGAHTARMETPSKMTYVDFNECRRSLHLTRKR